MKATKINENAYYLNNTMNKLDLIGIYRISYATNRICTFFKHTKHVKKYEWLLGQEILTNFPTPPPKKKKPIRKQNKHQTAHKPHSLTIIRNEQPKRLLKDSPGSIIISGKERNSWFQTISSTSNCTT